jgi:hypothetical protein
MREKLQLVGGAIVHKDCQRQQQHEMSLGSSSFHNNLELDKTFPHYFAYMVSLDLLRSTEKRRFDLRLWLLEQWHSETFDAHIVAQASVSCDGPFSWTHLLSTCVEHIV